MKDVDRNDSSLLTNQELREIIKGFRGRYGKLPEYASEVTPRDRAIAWAQWEKCVGGKK